METRYLPTFLYKEYDEKMLEILNKMNSKGYSLKDIHFLMKFVQDNQLLKYQIDYLERNEEQDAVYKELGYFHIGSYAGRHIYASRNKDAMDLNTDYEAYKACQLKYYSLGVILFSLFILSLCYIFIKPILAIYASSLGVIYIHLDKVLSLSHMLSITLLIMYSVILMYFKRISIKKDSFSYTKFSKYDSVYYYGFIVITALYLVLCLYTKVLPISLFTLLLMVIPYTFLQYTAEYGLPKIASTKKRILFTVISMFAYLSLHTSFRFVANSLTTSTPTSNRFVQITTTDQARIYACSNEAVANEIYVYFTSDHPSITDIASTFEKCTIVPFWTDYSDGRYYVFTKQRFIIKEGSVVVESKVIENMEDDLKHLEQQFAK